MKRLSALLPAVALLLVLAPPAAAAAPGNDSITSPTVINSLPYTDGPYDASEATTGLTDPGFCHGGSPDADTVWYAFTSSADMRLVATTAGSDYDTTLYVGTSDGAGGLNVLACNDDAQDLTSRLVFEAEASTTYLFMVGVCCGGGREAGNLVFNLDVAPPPPGLGATFDAVASVNRAGVATVTGTATCTGPVDDAWVGVWLRQAVGRFAITGGGGSPVTCDADGEPFSIPVEAFDGKFAGGHATAAGSASASGPGGDEFIDWQQTIRLRRG